MAGFTKLFSGLVHSTVWREDMHVKVVWITMLALADRNGCVLASLPGLADAARVSLDQCKDALEILSGPDAYSRTKEHEGRRIEECDGGWRLLNYLKYRQVRDDENRRQQIREAVARHRSKPVINVSRESQGKPIAEAEAEAERKTTSVAVAPVAFSWSRQAAEDWIERYGGTAPGGRIGSALKPLVAVHGWLEVRAAWRSYLTQTEAEYASAQRFSATYGRWSGTAAPAASKSGTSNRAVLERFVKGDSDD